MSCAEALRRCPHATFVRPRHSVYRQYSRAVWEIVRGVVPAGRAHGPRRGLPRPGLRRARLRRRRACSPRPCRRPCAAPRASPARSASARRRSSPRWRATGASPAGSPSCCRVARPRSSRRSTCACCRGSARGRRSACARLGLDDARRARRALRRRARGAAPGQGRCAAARPRARHRPARAREPVRERLDQPRGDVRARRRRPRGAARRAAADGRPARRAPRRLGPRRAHGDDEGALPRLRDPQPLDVAAGRHRRREPASASSRARSSTGRSPTGPGALRLVGVGVSNLEPYRQLALPYAPTAAGRAGVGPDGG